MRVVPDPLSAAALAYLALPSLIFLLGWAELPVGLPIAALVVVAVATLAGQLPAQQESSRSVAAWGFLLLLAAGWAALAGGSHLTYANKDWITRDTVFADLILTAWPPSYGDLEGAPLVLRTAMGFFLPPALAAKTAGLIWAPAAMFVWTWIGAFLFLGLLPLPQKFSLRFVALAALPVLFSGMDALGIVLTLGHAPIFPLPFEWWGKWTYSSLTAQLFWAPNHALALFIGTALFFRYRTAPGVLQLAVVLLPLLLIWTPFAPIGLLPWFAWAMLQVRHSDTRLERVSKVQWSALLALTLLVAALFSAPGVPAAFSDEVAAGGRLDASHDGLPSLLLAYAQFIGCEFLILALVLHPFAGTLRREWALATTLLLLIPLIRFGPSNDWVLRVATPSLVVLMIVTAHALGAGIAIPAMRLRLVPVVLVISIGAATPVSEITRALTWRRSPPNYGSSLLQDQRGYLAPHYIGRLEGAPRAVLFRSPVRVPEAEARLARVPASLRLR